MGDNFDPSKEDHRANIGTIDWDSNGLDSFPLRKAVILDPTTLAQITLDHTHHEIHAGELHIAVASTLAGAGAALDVLFKSPSVVPGFGATGHPWDKPRRRKAHMELNIISALASTLRFYKNSTKTFNPAATVNYWNRNFHAFAASEKLYTSAMSICVSSGGTEASTDLLGPIFLGSSTAGPLGIRIGGSDASRNEYILEPDAWQRIELVSRAADNALTITAEWYDHAERVDYTG